MTKNHETPFRHIIKSDKKMTKIPASVLSVTSMLLHVIIVPVFFLCFILLYESAWMMRFLDEPVNGMVINTLILSAIMVGILALSRIAMTMQGREGRLSWLQYILWSATEWIVSGCFMALYMALLYGDYGYFPALGRCMILLASTITYPYLIIDFVICTTHPDEQELADADLVRFADSTGRLKLVIAREVLLYIIAQENYVSIHYLEAGIVKEYVLRQSMRGIEELMAKHGIVRCHRSYFVNPRHVKVLRRDKEGMIQAELDVAVIKPVPVSPKYYDQLSKMLL